MPKIVGICDMDGDWCIAQYEIVMPDYAMTNEEFAQYVDQEVAKLRKQRTKDSPHVLRSVPDKTKGTKKKSGTKRGKVSPRNGSKNKRYIDEIEVSS